MLAIFIRFCMIAAIDNPAMFNFGLFVTGYILEIMFGIVTIDVLFKLALTALFGL